MQKIIEFIKSLIENSFFNSMLGLFIGGIITYIFNKKLERKKLREVILQNIYDKLFLLIDKSIKATQDILMSDISEILKKQKEIPTNDADILEMIDLQTKNELKNIQKNINIVIDLNLYLAYHNIPLKDYKEYLEVLTKNMGQVKDAKDRIEEIYKSFQNQVGYIKIDDDKWNELIEKENLIKEYTNLSNKKIVSMSYRIQQNYYIKTLGFK